MYYKIFGYILLLCSGALFWLVQGEYRQMKSKADKLWLYGALLISVMCLLFGIGTIIYL